MENLPATQSTVTSSPSLPLSLSKPSNDTPLVILPCAGWGKRIGNPAAKELLVHASEEKPLISWPIALAKKLGWPVIIVSRKDKVTLNDWVNSQAQTDQLALHLIDSSKEWPDSILACQKLWKPKNILILPDTRFQPSNLVFDLIQDLNRSEISLAGHLVDDPENWGMIDIQSQELSGSEKAHRWEKGNWAWGLIAFREQIGAELFSHLLSSTLNRKDWNLKAKYSIRFLQQFNDLTRGIWKTSTD